MCVHVCRSFVHSCVSLLCSLVCVAPLFTPAHTYNSLTHVCIPRIPPSSTLLTTAAAEFLVDTVGYTQACVISTNQDNYSVKGVEAFVRALNLKGGTVVKSIQTPDSPTADDADAAVLRLKDELCNVVFIMVQIGPGATIFRSAVHRGIMGPDSGYVWFHAFSDVPSVASLAEEQGTLEGGLTIPGIDLRAELKGSFGLSALQPEGDKFDAFVERYESLPSTKGTCGAPALEDTPLLADCACASGTDDGGSQLYQVRKRRAKSCKTHTRTSSAVCEHVTPRLFAFSTELVHTVAHLCSHRVRGVCVAPMSSAYMACV